MPQLGSVYFSKAWNSDHTNRLRYCPYPPAEGIWPDLSVPTLTFRLLDNTGATPAAYCRVKVLTLSQFSTNYGEGHRSTERQKTGYAQYTNKPTHLEHEASRGLSGQ